MIGGGAVLDMVSFAAAIAHRGIRVVRFPTTVLAQADSGVGVKNSINLFGKKNFVGTFVPPFAVINDFDFLETLEPRDRIAGVVEAVKVALLKDAAFFEDHRRQRRARGHRHHRPAVASSRDPRSCTCSTSAATAIRSSWAARGRSTSGTGRRTSSNR